jgi:cystathionine gamma-synthase
MDKSSENAMELAKWLKGQDKVTKVCYPGLPDHPGHEIMKKQSRGFGAMVTFELETKEMALYILENVRLIQFAESLGGTESLLTYPITQTHADVPKELLDKNGITDRVLRLSVGIEDVSDLIEEFERVFSEL